MSSKDIACKDCQNTFEFLEGEQKHFAKLGFPDPVRCADCRVKRKATKDSQQQTNFDRA